MKEITVIFPEIIESGSLSGREVIAIVTNVGLPGPAGTNGKTFVYSFPGNLIVRTGSIRVYVEDKMKITHVRAAVGLIPSGQSIILQIKKNGAAIYTTLGNRPSILSGSHTIIAPLPDDVYLDVGDFLTVDVVQAGAPSPGGDLTVQIRGDFL